MAGLASRGPPKPAPPHGPEPVAATASSSAASSQVVGSSPSTSAAATRADQIVYRFYLKTVGVLVDARVTHYGGQLGERKKDRWVGVGGQDGTADPLTTV